MTNYLATVTLALLASGAIAAGKPAASTAGTAHYTLAPSGNSLTFTFVQEGSQTPGSFKDFSVAFAYDEKNLAASSLDVKVQMTSVFTDLEDRDSGIRDADVFDIVKFPLGEYHASSLVKSAKGIEAVGKLTVRGITRVLRIPLVIKPITVAGKPALELSGSTSLKRLAYGVGQGEWKSTKAVANDIKLQWKVQLVKVPAAG